MSELTVSAIQMACSDSLDANLDTAERLVRIAQSRGAQVILLPELFDYLYFCQDEAPKHLALAHPVETHPAVTRFTALARELSVVLPISFYEQAGQAKFNSIVIVDADGAHLGVYRKTHIPQGSGYQEKYYFTPGDTGFRVWDTAFGRIGVGICWDQWFPECARSMALMGAEVLFYPTAIGSELLDPAWDSAGHWQRVMQGHAGANAMPLVAANRFGPEAGLSGTELNFYGSSIIADQTGEKQAEADRGSEAVLTHRFDRGEVREFREAWGLFRDRRPEHYGPLMTHDGKT